MDATMDTPRHWFGHGRHLVRQPSEDVFEDAEFGCIADGLVFSDETHADVLYGIA